MLKGRYGYSIGILSILMTVFTLSIALTIVCIPLFNWSLQAGGIPEHVGIDRSVILHNYYVLLRYLHIPWITELNMPDFPTSPSAQHHFYEVKQLFALNYIVLVISGVLSVRYIKQLHHWRQLWLLKHPFSVASWMPLGVVVSIMLFFDQLFIWFHQIAFQNDDWLFNPVTDPIIQVLTQDFFMYCFLCVCILFELFCITLYLVGRYHDKLKTHRTISK